MQNLKVDNSTGKPRTLTVSHIKRHNPAPGQNANTSHEAKQETREVVNGVRRVWGTMRGCSCRTVLSTLQKLSTVAVNLEVRRKYKKRGNSEVRWWFLIRGEEPTLQTLEQEWENVENSTSWRLEQCYRLVCPTAQNSQPDDESENDNAQTTMHLPPCIQNGEDSFLLNQ